MAVHLPGNLPKSHHFEQSLQVNEHVGRLDISVSNFLNVLTDSCMQHSLDCLSQ